MSSKINSMVSHIILCMMLCTLLRSSNVYGSAEEVGCDEDVHSKMA